MVFLFGVVLDSTLWHQFACHLSNPLSNLPVIWSAIAKLVYTDKDVYSATAVGYIKQIAFAGLEPECPAEVVNGYRNLASVDPATCLLAPHCIKVKLDALKGCAVFAEDCLESLHRVNVLNNFHYLSPCGIYPH